nr:MAG: nonstructural polyprotein [Totiviridae sp.]
MEIQNKTSDSQNSESALISEIVKEVDRLANLNENSENAVGLIQHLTPPRIEHDKLNPMYISGQVELTDLPDREWFCLSEFIPEEHLDALMEIPFGLPIRSGVVNTIFERSVGKVAIDGDRETDYPVIGTQREVFGLYPNGACPTIDFGKGLTQLAYHKLIANTWPSVEAGYILSKEDDHLLDAGHHTPYVRLDGEGIIVVEMMTQAYESFLVRMSFYDYFCFTDYNDYRDSDLLDTPCSKFSTRRWMRIDTSLSLDDLTDEDIWKLIFSDKRYINTRNSVIWHKMFTKSNRHIETFNHFIQLAYPEWYAFALIEQMELPDPSTIPEQENVVFQSGTIPPFMEHLAQLAQALEQNPEIPRIQMGSFSAVAEFFKSNDEKKDDAITFTGAVKNMGKLAETANSIASMFENQMNNPTSHIMNLFMKLAKVAKYTDDLLCAAIDFAADPFGTVKKILTDWTIEYNVEDLSIIDAAWMSLGYAGITGLAYYFYSSHPIIASGFMLIANYNLVKQLTSQTSSHMKLAVALTVAMIGLMQLPQSHSNCVQIQSEISVAAMAASFAATLGVAAAGISNYSSCSDIFKFTASTMKPFVMTARGLPFVALVFDYIGKMLKDIVNYIFGPNCVWLALTKGSINDADMRDYIEYSLTQTTDSLVTSIALEPKERERWERMCKLHESFISLFASAKTRPDISHVGYSMYTRAFSAFRELLIEYQKIRHARDPHRPEPFIFWVYGEPGVGKTVIRDTIINRMYLWHRELEPDFPSAATTGMTYVRNPGDKYWSNYNGHFCTAYDDVGQSLAADNPEFHEIMACASTNTNALNMADIKDKGRLFSSRLMFLCSNTRDPSTNNLILCPKAINRRRHVVVEMLRPMADGKVCMSSKSEFNSLLLRVRDNTDSSIILKDFPDSGYASDDVALEEMYTWLKPIYTEHVKTQKKIVEDKERELMKVLHPDLWELSTLTQIDPEVSGTLSIAKENPSDPIVEEAFLMKYRAHFKKEPSKVILDWIRTPKPVAHIIPTAVREKVSECFEHLRQNLPSAKAGGIALLGLASTIAATAGIYKLCQKIFGESTSVQAYDSNVRFVPRGKRAVVQEKFLPLSGHTDIQSFQSEYITYSGKIHPRSDWKRVTMTVAAFMKPMANVFNELDEELSERDLLCAHFMAKQFIKHNRKGIEIGEYPHAKFSKVSVWLPPDLVDSMPEFQSTTVDLLHIYEKSLFMISALNPDKFSYSRVHIVNIRGRLFLAPYHFAQRFTKETQVQLSHQTIPTRNVNILPSDIHRIDSSDWCIIHIKHGMPEGRDILNHFATRQELQSIRVFDALLLSYGPNLDGKRIVHSYVGEAGRFDVPISGTVDGKEVVHPTGFFYRHQTVDGSCGAMLIATDSTVRSKVMGLHFAYTASVRKAYASLISRERLVEACDKIIPPQQQVVINPPVAIQCKMVDVAPEFLDEGVPRFECIGRVTNAPSQPRRHRDLFRSPAWNEVYPASKDLSVLVHTDSRMKEEFRGLPTILNRNVLGYDAATCEWPSRELTLAGSYLREVFNTFKETTKREVKSLEWAINGEWIGESRLEHAEPLRLDTSAGYGFPGKKQAYFDVSDPKKIKISDVRLQNDVDRLWEEWQAGVTTGTVWTNALKSEPLKLSKIELGKTRTFCVGQTNFLLAVKRLFGAWTVAMKNSKIDSFSCLGMDVRSADWSYLYAQLRQIGPNGLDLDFQNYDRIAVLAQLADEVADAVNEWYDDGPIYARMRKIAIHEMIFSYMLCGDLMVRKFQGNPSGNPLTTELNNCINILMFVIVYLLIAHIKSPGDYSIKSLKNNVCMKTYGDDFIVSLSPSCETWFDVKLIVPLYAAHGITVTPADKESEIMIKPLEDLTFLKCHFVPSGISPYPWNAGLSKASIEGMMQFYRLQPNHGTREEAVQHNFIESCEYAYFWGKDYFEQHKQRCNKWIFDHLGLGYQLITLTYEELDARYRIKLGIAEPSSILSPTQLGLFFSMA